MIVSGLRDLLQGAWLLCSLWCGFDSIKVECWNHNCSKLHQQRRVPLVYMWTNQSARDSAGTSSRVLDSLKSIWDLFGHLFSSFILVKGSLWTPNFFDLPLLQIYVGFTMLYLGSLLFHFWRVLGVSMGFFRPYKIFPKCHPCNQHILLFLFSP